MSERPEGALETKPLCGPIYAVVPTNTLDFFKVTDEELNTVEDRILDKWLNGEVGYLFDNYFHALAYSLKCKAAQNDQQKSHKALP